MNGRTIRKYLFLPLVAIAALSMTGCTKGEYTAPGGTVNESGFRLSVVTKSMSRKEVVTRASDPKTEAEREIKELHVFLFGPDCVHIVETLEKLGIPNDEWKLMTNQEMMQ